MPDMTAVWPTDQSPGNVSSEARWRKMARVWVPSGVDASPLAVGGGGTSGLAPTLVAGPTINVAAGACWVDGHYCELNPGTSIPATANGLLVVRFTPADGRAQLVYVDAATVCTQTAATWELPIARMLAGALQDIRWFASSNGELAFLHAANAAVLTAAHTAASPLDVDVFPAVYCDGSPLEIIFNGLMQATSGICNVALWVDAAAASFIGTGVPAGGVLAVCYSTQNVPGFGRGRIQPAAGVHQIRSRAYLSAGATGGAVNIFHSLSVRRV